MQSALARAILLLLCLSSFTAAQQLPPPPQVKVPKWNDPRVVFLYHPKNPGCSSGSTIEIEGGLYIVCAGHAVYGLRDELEVYFCNGLKARGIAVAKNLRYSPQGGGDSAILYVPGVRPGAVYKIPDEAPKLPQVCRFKGFPNSEYFRMQHGTLSERYIEAWSGSAIVKSGESGGPVSDESDTYLLGLISADGYADPQGRPDSIITPWNEIKGLVDSVRENIVKTKGQPLKDAQYCQQKWPVSQVLFFNSPYCGPCQEMKPIVSSLQQEGLVFRTVDVSREPDLARQYAVTMVPQFIPIDEHGRQYTNNRGGLIRQIGRTTRDGLRSLFFGSHGGNPGHRPQDNPTPQNPPPGESPSSTSSSIDDGLKSLLREGISVMEQQTTQLERQNSELAAAREALSTLSSQRESTSETFKRIEEKIISMPAQDYSGSITLINQRLNEIAKTNQENYAKLSQEILSIKESNDNRQPDTSEPQAPASLKGIIRRVPKNQER